MNLIIVESPTKAKTLSRFLGKDFVVEATMGHIKDLPKSKLGVDIEKNFKPDYIPVEKRKKEIDKLKKEAKKAKFIFLATDPDREGEAIASHAEEILSENKLADPDQLKRIVFHEITESAVTEAIQNPRKVDRHFVNAQIARRVLDRLVGYKLSPLLWKKVRRGLSAGRVQTVTVRLIVEKEREIEAFNPQEYWDIWCNVKSKKTKTDKESFDIRLVKINDNKADVKNEKDAKTVVSDLEKSKYTVFDIRKKEVRKNPYPPFTTSTMSQTASRLFGWSAKKTMSVAQRLYEEGLITYHRTDSLNLAITAVAGVRKYIEKTYGESYLPETPRFYKTKSKSAQEAHEAIRPTNVSVAFKLDGEKFVREGEKLYELIWKRFVACQMKSAVYDETVIDVDADPKNPKAIRYLLRVSGQIMKFDGWKKLFDGNQNGEVYLPNVDKAEELDLVKVFSEQKFTLPPARFNEASLIKTLEKLGIGRPSTYAPTISTIQLRNYVEKDEGKFRPTTIGNAVNDFLIKNFEKVFDYDFTAGMEAKLDEVAAGEQKWQEMMSDFYKPFAIKLKSVEENAKRVKIETEKLGKKCPKCKEGDLVIRVGRFGKFVSCLRFPDCDYKEKYLEKINMKCPDCKEGEVIVKTTGKGRKFYGCSRYPECKFASWQKPGLSQNNAEVVNENSQERAQKSS